MSTTSDGRALVTDGIPVGRASLFAGKLWFWLPILPLVALDLWSKAAIFAYVAENAPRGFEVFDWNAWVRFSLVRVENRGTIWGLFHKYHFPLVVLRFLAIGVIVFLAARTPRRERCQLLVLGTILAGAIGNLYDNLTQREGGVRDFLLFEFGSGRTQFPAFNVADSCITCGAIALAWLLLRTPPAVGNSQPS